MVLAATFGALSVLPLLFLVQMAFLVGFGVLLDTFVVRSLVVPAAVAIIGDRVWWPSRLAKGRRRRAGARARARLTTVVHFRGHEGRAPGVHTAQERPLRSRSSQASASANAASPAIGGTGLLSRPSARA